MAIESPRPPFPDAADVNEAGATAGQTGSEFVYGTASNPFVFADGQVNSLQVSGLSGAAFAINDAGTVVGLELTSSEGDPVATVWNGSNDYWLPSLTDGVFSAANDIDQAGAVVGYSGTADDIFGQHAVTWAAQTSPPLILADLVGTGSSSAMGINERGTIVGWSGAYPVAWHAGVPAKLPGGAGSAADVNNAGSIVGSLTTLSGATHAIMWKLNVAHRLPTRRAFTAANAINDHGDIVGSDGPNAVLWTRGHRVSFDSLIQPGSGWHILQANDISNSRFIAATAIKNGQEWAVRLSPIRPQRQLRQLNHAVRHLNALASTRHELLKLLTRAQHRLADRWIDGTCATLAIFTNRVRTLVPNPSGQNLITAARALRLTLRC